MDPGYTVQIINLLVWFKWSCWNKTICLGLSQPPSHTHTKMMVNESWLNGKRGSRGFSYTTIISYLHGTVYLSKLFARILFHRLI